MKNMKILRTFFAATIMLLCTTLQAQDFYIGGLYYNILSESEKTVEVTNSVGGISAFNYSDTYKGQIIIPEEAIYNGTAYKVVAIGDRAFWGCENLDYVNIPSSVTSIGDEAFLVCENLLAIIGGTNIESIGYRAFEVCFELRKFTIPNTTVSIGDRAFIGCRSLKSIVIGENVTEIGKNVFSNTAIDDVFSNIPADRLFALTSNSDLTSNATLIVPAGAKEAYVAADGWKDFANIVEKEERFKDQDFEYNIISYKNNCAEIRQARAFDNEIAIPSTVEHDGTTYTITKIASMGFYGTAANSISLPNTITEIDGAAFAFSAIEEVALPSSLEIIGEVAFGASSLKTVHIPASVKMIQRNPFANCAQLESISVDTENTRYIYYGESIMDLKSRSIISGCKNTMFNAFIQINSIAPWAFSGCAGLTELSLDFGTSNNITIGDYAFNYCTNLKSITLHNGVTTIGDYAFKDCTNLESITLNDEVTHIGDYAFTGCNLTEFIVPAHVTSFCESPLQNNPLLATITVDEENTVYDSRDNCNAIINTATNTLVAGCKNTIIPDDITAIGSSAFRECSTLTEITIPANVTKIGGAAFCGCSALKKITSLIPAERLQEIELTDFAIFDDEIYENCVLEIPEGAREAYEHTHPWYMFRMIVEPDYNYFELNVSAAGYATLYLDFNAHIPNGVELYTASSVDGNRLMMEQVEYGILPANTGVLVKAEQGTYTFVDTYGTTNGYIENNLFRGSAEDVYITPAKEAKYYVLSMKDGVVGMYEDALSGGTFKNNANKAYLVLGEKNLGIYDEEVDTEDPGMQLSNSYYFDFSGTTAIDPIVTEVNDNIYYDLSGRRVENPTRGIYILNGKKILVK